MSESQDIKPELLDFCGKIVEDIEQEMDEQEREVQFLFDELNPEIFKYSNKQFLDEGGMKTIYRVKDSSSKRSVAFAELKKKKINPANILSFYNEARITALLEHPNIVPIYEIGHNKDVPYFTMKEIHGSTLGSVLKRIKKNPDETCEDFSLNSLLNIYMKICDAISFAHSRKILHLDLKPDNIHVGEFGEVLVIDWGLAKNLDSDPLIKHATTITSEIDVENTLDGFVKGTIGYMAPEQARGENDDKDERTDIYALGAILYSILTLESPYTNQHGVKKSLTMIASGQYKPISEEKYPAALCAVIKKAMAREPEKRYQKVSELTHDIQLHLDGFATKAQEANYTEIFKLFIKRNVLTASLVVTFFIILFITSVGFIISLKNKEVQARESEKKAIANELIAKENEQKALELFNNLKKTTEAKSRLEKISTPLTLRLYHAKIHDRKFEDALKVLNKIYRPEIQDGMYWYFRGRSFLGELNIDEAIKNFERAKENKYVEPVEWKIGKTLQLLKKHKKKLSTDTKSILFLATKLRGYESEIVAHMFFTATNKLISDPKEKIDFVRKAILATNPNIEDLNIEGEWTEYGLDLNLSDNKELRNISALSRLNLHRLQLRNCNSIDSFSWLKGSNVEYIDLTGVGAKYFKQHVHLENLKTIIMRNSFFRYQWLSGPKVETIDFRGSVVDLAGIRIKNVARLNLCTTHTTSFTKIVEFEALKKLIIPADRRVSKAQHEHFRKRKIEVIRCDCTNKSCDL
ncbi:MAG: serine/threonine protein kinase [Lentisphaeraceae bacterium]|nr:serine/threonine protein kinase [Lentisphaeraceae bacterium]